MHPLPEYPRPAMRRDSYENLNGLWKYAITQTAESVSYTHLTLPTILRV